VENSENEEAAVYPGDEKMWKKRKEKRELREK
jgi:hypothetical protein